MKIKKITIKNFRNFKNSEVELDNKNIVIGNNGVGKTNLIHAFKLLVDYKTRKLEIKDSDFHTNNTNDPIEIIGEFKYELENDNTYSDILKTSKMCTCSIDRVLYVKFIAKWCEENQMHEKQIFAGSDLDELEELRLSTISSCTLDKYFYCFYESATNNLGNNLKIILKHYLNEEKVNDELNDKIRQHMENIFNEIKNDNTVQKVRSEIQIEINKYLDKLVTIVLNPNNTISKIYSSLELFDEIDIDSKSIHYNFSDGIKKTINLALINHIVKLESENKIPITFIEEPENNLHLSLQDKIANKIFNNSDIPYLFVSTHSEKMFENSNNTNVVRIQKEKNLTKTYSSLYQLDANKFKKLGSLLQSTLAEALFSPKVLIVEGYSERDLFEYIKNNLRNRGCINEDVIILNIHGTNISEYYTFLTKLGISVYVKTDNDIKFIKEKGESDRSKKYIFDSYGRIKRCFDSNYNGTYEEIPAEINLKYQRIDDESDYKKKVSLELQKKQYSKVFDEFKCEKIYLSNIDLEHDLYDAIPITLQNFYNVKSKEKYKIINKMQSKKQINLLGLLEELTDDDIDKILENKNFKFLKEFFEYGIK